MADRKLTLCERVLAAVEPPRGEIHLRTNVKIEHRRNGELIDTREFHNLVTGAGKAAIASRINGADAVNAFAYIGIGTGGTGAVIGDTELDNEVGEDGENTTTHKSATVDTEASGDTGEGNDRATFVATFTFSGIASPPSAIVESGVFNAASTGTLLCRQTFAALNVTNGDSLTITWKIDVD